MAKSDDLKRIKEAAKKYIETVERAGFLIQSDELFQLYLNAKGELQEALIFANIKD